MTAPVDSLPAGFLDHLTEYVAIPSDSRSATPETMRAAADWLAARLCSSVRIVVDE